MSYHSKFNGETVEEACGFPLFPITPKAAYNTDTSTHDIVDEAIHLFRANILFKNYQVQGSGDRAIIYLTSFIQKCLEQMHRYPAQDQAIRVIGQIMNDAQATDCGNNTFFMNKMGMLSQAKSPAEKTKCAAQMKKMMDECSKRLLEYLYRPQEGDMNRKFWMALGKKPFMGQKFTDKQYAN